MAVTACRAKYITPLYRVRAAAYAGVRVRECAARVNLRERAAIDFALELVADCASFGVGAACPHDDRAFPAADGLGYRDAG